MAFEFDMLSVDAEVKDGKLVAKAHGPLGEALQPLVDGFCNTINSLKVIYRHEDGSIRQNLYNPPQPTKAGMRAIPRRILREMFNFIYPATGTLAITYRCQARCIHCSAQRFIDPSRTELTTDEVKSVIDQMINLWANIVVFTGGDPLVRKDLPELINYVGKDRANTLMFTNGLGLTEKKVKELADAGLDAMYISFDHVDPALHNEWRGVPTLYERALEGAERARAAGILTGISTYATDQTVEDGSVERLLVTAQENGFHEVTVFDCIPSGNFLKETGRILTPQGRRKLVKLCKKYHDMDHPMGVICQSIINSPDGVGCFGFLSQFYMTAYGDIAPCDFNPVCFGNIRENTLEQIWTKARNHHHFSRRHLTCRMQTPSYRKKYIDILPDDCKLPVPIETIHALWEEKGFTKELEKLAATSIF